jgi:hypothetical protein
MTIASGDDELGSILRRLGIEVPNEDIPFLQRALQKQAALRQHWDSIISPEIEPALTFKPVGGCGP